MAKERMINTRFWIDDYISNLDPIEKLLFLYFITNTATDISGVYEIPVKTIAVDTGIDKEMVLKVIKRFDKDGKIKYRDGWVAIKNFIKHQKNNPKIKRGIEISMTKCPQWCIDYIYSIDSLSHSNSNLNSNSNTNTAKTKFSTEGAEVIKYFEEWNPACKAYYKNTTQRKACDDLVSIHGLTRLKTLILDTLPKTNGIAYMPSITTPLQLLEKYSALEAAVQKYKNKLTSAPKGRGIA